MASYGWGRCAALVKNHKVLARIWLGTHHITTQNGEASVVDESALKQIPEGIETLKVPIWEPFGLYKKLTGKKKGAKLTPGTVSEKEASFTQKLSVWVRGNLFIPDARMFWIQPASKALNAYLATHKVDAIVSTGPPHSTHMIALNVIKKNKIPWLADFRDPWTNIDFYDKLRLTNWADKKHRRLEQEVLQHADKVVTVSWSWAEDFRRISDVMPMVITNGYDPADFVTAGSVTLDEKFTITHAGSLNEDRNPHALWKALEQLSKEIKGFSADLEIKFIGQVAPVAIAELTTFKLDKNLNLIDNLPHQEVITEMIKSQLLLLPLNDTPNIDGVVPGKLYEYLGAKRPIVCIGKTDGDAAKIIKETNGGSVTDFGDVEALISSLRSFYSDFKKQELKIDSKGYQKYSRQLLAGAIAEELNKIAN